MSTVKWRAWTPVLTLGTRLGLLICIRNDLRRPEIANYPREVTPSGKLFLCHKEVMMGLMEPLCSHAVAKGGRRNASGVHVALAIRFIACLHFKANALHHS